MSILQKGCQGPVEDAYVIHQWRNDKRIRDISLNKQEIPLTEHLEWFKNTLDRTDRLLILAEIASVPIGVVRFDLHETWAEVSVFMNPDYIGKRFGASMYSQAETLLKNELARKNYTQITELKAVILAGNTRSESFFLRLGFRKALTEYRKGLM